MFEGASCTIFFPRYDDDRPTDFLDNNISCMEKEIAALFSLLVTERTTLLEIPRVSQSF